MKEGAASLKQPAIKFAAAPKRRPGPRIQSGNLVFNWPTNRKARGLLMRGKPRGTPMDQVGKNGEVSVASAHTKTIRTNNVSYTVPTFFYHDIRTKSLRINFRIRGNEKKRCSAQCAVGTKGVKVAP